MSFRLTVVVIALLTGATNSARAQDNEGVASLLARIEQAATSGDAAAFLGLLTTGANRGRAESVPQSACTSRVSTT